MLEIAVCRGDRSFKTDLLIRADLQYCHRSYVSYVFIFNDTIKKSHCTGLKTTATPQITVSDN